MSEQTMLLRESNWRELRDERGRLYARIDERLWLLEIRRNHESVIFDLRDYLELLHGLEIEADIE